MVTRIYPPLDDLMSNPDDEDPGEEHISPRGAEANRFYERPKMRQFEAPSQGDLNVYPTDMAGPADYIEPINMQQRDPRLDVIEQMARQGQVQRPGMKTEQDYRQQFKGESPDFTPQRPRMPGLPEYDGKPVPGEMEEHDAAQQMTDEELMAEIQRQMDPNKPSFPRDLLNGKVNPSDNDSDALAPFTGEYSQDLKILERELKVPGADQGELNRMFNELHGDDEINDRDEPDTEDDLRRGR